MLKNLLIALTVITNTMLAADSPSPFRLVNEIQHQINKNGILVVFGAPCSGKSELVDIAVPENKYVFDLSDAFVTAYSEKSGQDKKTVKKYYENAFTPEQALLKQEQVLWLQDKDPIVHNLISEESNVVIFDEFDFTGTFTPSSDEETAMIQIVEIAKEVSDAGKRVIFIVHAAAKNSELFWASMEGAFGYKPKDIAKTQFFTDEEEAYLLSQVDWSAEEKNDFLAFAQGSPTAYLPILKHKPDTSVENLHSQTKFMSELVCRVTKHVNRPEVWAALLAVANGELNLDDIQDEALIERMLESSFVGQKNGRLVMPSFSRDALRTK